LAATTTSKALLKAGTALLRFEHLVEIGQAEIGDGVSVRRIIEDFHADPGRTYTRWAVYTALACTTPRPGRPALSPMLRFDVAREIKVTGVQMRARVSRRSTIDALQWLIERGYLIEHGRGHNQMRRLTLAWARMAEFPACTPSAAA
jgi:hypothetical protein